MGLTVEGLDEFVTDLIKIYSDATIMYRRCAFEGARVLADEMKAGIEGLKVQNGYGTEKKPLNGVNGYVKADLRDGLGISKIETENFVTNVSVGFSGYSKRVENVKWLDQTNNSVAIQMEARTVESGTSWMRKQPFVRKAINRAKKKIDNAIEKEATKFIKERMK